MESIFNNAAHLAFQCWKTSERLNTAAECFPYLDMTACRRLSKAFEAPAKQNTDFEMLYNDIKKSEVEFKFNAKKTPQNSLELEQNLKKLFFAAEAAEANII